MVATAARGGGPPIRGVSVAALALHGAALRIMVLQAVAFCAVVLHVAAT